MVRRKEVWRQCLYNAYFKKYAGEAEVTLIHHKIFQNTCTSTILITISIAFTIPFIYILLSYIWKAIANMHAVMYLPGYLHSPFRKALWAWKTFYPRAGTLRKISDQMQSTNNKLQITEQSIGWNSQLILNDGQIHGNWNLFTHLWTQQLKCLFCLTKFQNKHEKMYYR